MASVELRSEAIQEPGTTVIGCLRLLQVGRGLNKGDIMSLKTEIATDPLGRGYSGMTDLEVANDLNTVYRTQNVESVTGRDIFEAAVRSEYLALAAEDKDLLHVIISMGSILVNGANTKAALLAMFGAGTTTRTNLAVLQIRDVSRAQELGLPFVYEGHIQEARL